MKAQVATWDWLKRSVLVGVAVCFVITPAAALTHRSIQKANATVGLQQIVSVPPLDRRDLRLDLNLGGPVSAGAVAESTDGQPVKVNVGQVIQFVGAADRRQRVVLPVQLSAGRVLSRFSDPTLGVQIVGSVMNVQLRSPEGILSGVVEAKIVSVSGAGAFADIEITDIKLRSAPQTFPVGGSVGTVWVAIEAQMNALDMGVGSEIRISVQDRPDARARSAFEEAAILKRLDIDATAYAVHVEKSGVQDGRHIGAVTIEMKVGPAFVIPYGLENMWIVRQADSGVVQFLPTRFVGLDSANNSVFRADTAEGLSVFALVGVMSTPGRVAAPPAAQVPASTITPLPTVTPVPQVNETTFDADIITIIAIAAGAIGVFFLVVILMNRRRSW